MAVVNKVQPPPSVTIELNNEEAVALSTLLNSGVDKRALTDILKLNSLALGLRSIVGEKRDVEFSWVAELQHYSD